MVKGLGHPCIPAGQRKTNDFSLRGLGSLALVTGSNMSGKSTFLKTLGINLCLAQAGGFVCASAFRSSWLRIHGCLKMNDSVTEGLSSFYAEVKLLKSILEAAGDWSAPPVLALIDEIFRGTNNRERIIGVSRGNSVGWVRGLLFNRPRSSLAMLARGPLKTKTYLSEDSGCKEKLPHALSRAQNPYQE
ncbi:MAG: hypothetical protein AB1611_02890 [bacterium]